MFLDTVSVPQEDLEEIRGGRIHIEWVGRSLETTVVNKVIRGVMRERISAMNVLKIVCMSKESDVGCGT